MIFYFLSFKPPLLCSFVIFRFVPELSSRYFRSLAGFDQCLNQRYMFTLLKRDKRWLSQSTLRRIFSIRRDKKGFSSSGFWLLAVSLISYEYNSLSIWLTRKFLGIKSPARKQGFWRSVASVSLFPLRRISTPHKIKLSE